MRPTTDIRAAAPHGTPVGGDFVSWRLTEEPAEDHTLAATANPAVPETNTDDVHPGSRIGGYEIEGIAGRGGMGVVYRARDPQLGRRVGLKLVAPSVTRDPVVR